MKKLSLFIVIVLLLTIGIIPVAAITWGEPDAIHSNVGAMIVDWPDYGPWQWCSGTLIHPRVFLTAGHCTDGLDEYGIEQVWVNFAQDAVEESTLLDVEKVVTHPDYNWGPTSNPHDVGLLILSEPVEGITPVTLPDLGLLGSLKKSGELRDGPLATMFTVVGYGGSLDWPPPEIYYEDIRQVAESEYRAITKAWLIVSQNQAIGNGGTCYGDSGGPIFWTDEAGNEIQVGITSWGDAQCVASGFYYRTDISETRDFIDATIASLDE